ncbi:MAG: carboxypeptidase regulatory-like domain-containing protein, partial [Pseudomonadota bacterium]
ATVGACTKKQAASPAPAAEAPAPAGGDNAAAAGAAAKPGALGEGTIKGTVKFTGTAPGPKVLTTPDPFCARHPIKEEDLLVGAGGGLKNVIVRVVKGASGQYPVPATQAIVDQSGCLYRPRVQAVVAGQTVLIRNSDQTLHNVHTYRGASTLFNQAQIPGMAPMSKTFSDGGQIIKFRCDVHPWMTGYVAVVDNPFFAVSGDDGTFSIAHLPPGQYTVEAWHERLGTKTAEVTVPEGATGAATADIAFAAP